MKTFERSYLGISIIIVLECSFLIISPGVMAVLRLASLERLTG
jgi:hypothetical protein